MFNLQLSANFDDATAVNLGRLAGVDMIMLGKSSYDSIVIKGISVETGQYLIYDTIDKNNPNMDIVKQLVPYAIKYSDGKIVGWLYGSNVDTLSDNQIEMELKRLNS